MSNRPPDIRPLQQAAPIAGDGEAGRPESTRAEAPADPVVPSDGNEFDASTRTFNGDSRHTSEIEPASHSGRIASRYCIRSQLGRGGFGTVFEAWDEVLERTVAVKLAHRHRFEGSDGASQYLEEARAAAKLKHPNIVSVHDSGRDENGVPYVVFDYVPGETLASTRRNQNGCEAIAALMATVADAVHAAHTEGLVHRDLKPGNILIDRDGQPHVTDFGLAVSEQTQRDRAGEVAGSPSYMSPEQIQGQTQYLDGRSDIWSLGVVIYLLLADRLPFVGRSAAELMDEIVDREPKPPRQIDDSIPQALETICLKCLAKSVTDRYATAADLATDLRQFANNDVPGHRLPKATLAVLLIGLAVFMSTSGSPENHSASDGGASPSNTTAPELDSNHQTTEPETTEASRADAAQPVPGEWVSLFRNEPSVLLWPVASKNSRWDLNQNDEELWMTCDGRGLLQLGTIETDSFELTIDLFQSPWNGHFGLFLGAHKSETEAGPVIQFQTVEIDTVQIPEGKRYFLNRRVLTVSLESQRLLSRATPVSIPIEPLSPVNDASMHLYASGGRLTRLRWNGQDLAEFSQKHQQRGVAGIPVQGEFGLCIEGASAVVRRAELFITPAGN